MQTTAELQHALGVVADGKWGPKSQAALLGRFANKNAPGITEREEQLFASRMGVSLKQLRAVATVESRGSGFDRDGRPKILYERHIFHRLTDGKWSTGSFSNPKWGGYTEDSWRKLGDACGKDPESAFSSCSWGAFQVMGMHWSKLDYPSSYNLAYSTSLSEAAQYELLARFIEKNGMKDEMRAISTNPDDCRPFCRLYNGSDYERNDYHNKLAKAMR